MTDRIKVLYHCTEMLLKELDFKAEDVITAVGPSDESPFWWYGSLKGRLGNFPFTFIVRVHLFSNLLPPILYRT